MKEMAELFTVERVGKNPARFDMKKLEAINGDKIRALAVADLALRALPFMQAAQLIGNEPTADELKVLEGAVPLIQERVINLAEIPGLLSFLFLPEDLFAIDPDSATKVLTADARPIIKASISALTPLKSWVVTEIEAALRAALLEDLGLKPKNAFGPVRVAITGARISPPLFESLALLGRERSLARLSNLV